MSRSSDYTIQEKLHESQNSLIYRAVRSENQSSFILKALKESRPSPEHLAWFEREYNVTRKVKKDTVVQAYSFEKVQDRWCIILEDFDAQSLDVLDIAGKLTISDFLSIAIQIAQALCDIHAEKIIHKDINLSNIVFNPKTRQLKVIDFGLSTFLSHEIQSFCAPKLLEGTLAYISPEQTGRVNRVVDYRTDFYSLGVTFYILLTGKLPFVSEDPNQLVHSHIARLPTPIQELNHAVPPVVAEVVQKLLAKKAEDRYQSGTGLLNDLKACQQQWESTGQIPAFALGAYDRPIRFNLPQKLYGRETEAETLIKFFNEKSLNEGKVQIVTVAGPAGIGKTSLIQEVFPPLTQKNGIFVSGKFDQLLNRDLPYSAIIQAFSEFTKHILSLENEEIQDWKHRLELGLGNYAAVIVDAIASMELILGKHDKPIQLKPQEAQNRLQYALQKLFQTMVSPEMPMVFFLDDIQWADYSSLNFIETMATTDTKGGLVLILAFRDKDESETISVSLFVEQLRNSGARLTEFKLNPLSSHSVTEYTANALQVSLESSQHLAELVYKKTGGNPFFVGKFLSVLYEKKLIYPGNTGTWTWSVEEIQKQEISDNVVDFLIGEFQNFSESVQSILKLAACIGNQFEFKRLVRLSVFEATEVEHSLGEALEKELLVPLDQNYKLSMSQNEAFYQANDTAYKFSHDRIYQAAHALNTEAEKLAHHWNIGLDMLDSYDPTTNQQPLFELTNHLNLGFLTNPFQPDACKQLTELNLNAGKKAQSSAAYQIAFHYFRKGVDLLNELSQREAQTSSWDYNYPLALELYNASAETAQLSGQTELAQAYIDDIERNLKSVLDGLACHEVKWAILAANNDFLSVISMSLDYLKQFGIDFPESSPETIQDAFDATFQELGDQEPETLIDLPLMTEPDKRVAMDVMGPVYLAAFLIRPDLCPLMTNKMLLYSLRYGNHPSSIIAYMSFGVSLVMQYQKYAYAYKFKVLAERLIEKLDAYPIYPRYAVLCSLLVSHWREHFQTVLPVLKKAYQIGIENGESFHSANSLAVYHITQLVFGQPLTKVEPEYKESLEIIRNMGEEFVYEAVCIDYQSILNWMGQNDNPIQLEGTAFQEVEKLPIYESSTEIVYLNMIYFHKVILAYHLGEYQAATEFTKAFDRVKVPGYSFNPPVALYYALSHIELLSQTESAAEQQAHRAQFEEQLQLFEEWAELCPENYLHKYHILKAELARIDQDHETATSSYEQAIELAKKDQHFREEALAFELAGKYFHGRGQKRLATYYLQDAYYAYRDWGAVIKLHRLEKQFPDLLTFVSAKPSISGGSIVGTMSQTRSASGGDLDMASIVKASQVLSENIVLEKLIRQIMLVLMENAGAQRGVFIYKQSQQWFVEAEAVVVKEIQVERVHQVLAEFKQLPQKLIRYVIQAKESVVLDDALRDGLNWDEHYFHSQEIRSLLCQPITRQGGLIGVLYLENNLTTGAFTPDRLEVLGILAAQTAISMENAELYDNLEEKVQQRTAELKTAHEKILALEKEATEKQMAGGFAHEIRNALAGPKLLAEKNLGLDSPAPHVSLSLANSRRMKEIYFKLQKRLGHEELQNILVLMKQNFVNEEQIEGSFQLIYQSLSRALVITQQIMEYSKLGQQTAGLERIDPDRLIEEIIAEHQAMFAEQAITVHLKLLSNGRQIEVAEGHYYTIVNNILLNAKDALIGPGSREQEERTIEVVSEVKGSTYQVRITDNGIGIPPENLSKIYDTFFSTKPESGMGLGLGFVQKIVFLYQGTIEAQSQVGQGTTFTVSFPAA